jgi:uracil-DNA glycosylase
MRPSGPIPARIAIVGEAPGAEEERIGEPFVGASGRLLTDVLHSVGIIRSSCFITNVCNRRPPGNEIAQWFSENKGSPDPTWKHVRGRWVHPAIADGLLTLQKHLAAVKPDLIIALGGTALWALTPHTGILKWRGSRLPQPEGWTVVPSIHPAAVLRQPEQIVSLRLDLLRAKNVFEGTQRPRQYTFIVPTGREPFTNEEGHRVEDLPFKRALALLEGLRSTNVPRNISCDIETSRGAIDCIGFADAIDRAFCLPILTRDSIGRFAFHWTVEQEAELRLRIAALFRHPYILWIGQNFLYDCQYFHRELMHFPTQVFDTMVGHHAIYSNLRKGLDFLSSMYAQDHIYWKDERKEATDDLDPVKRWTYNGKDCCITLEAYQGIQEQLAQEAGR